MTPLLPTVSRATTREWEDSESSTRSKTPEEAFMEAREPPVEFPELPPHVVIPLLRERYGEGARFFPEAQELSRDSLENARPNPCPFERSLSKDQEGEGKG